jgi:hypothetical protein
MKKRGESKENTDRKKKRQEMKIDMIVDDDEYNK